MRLDLIYAHFQAVDADPKSSKRIGDEIDIASLGNIVLT